MGGGFPALDGFREVGEINEIVGCEAGIKMAGVLLNISCNEIEWTRIESEYKGKLEG